MKDNKNIYNMCFPLVNKDNKYLGCAFKWDHSQFATCKHVLDSQDEVHIGFDIEQNPKFRKITKRLESHKYDLCLFEVEQSPDVPLLKHYQGEIGMGMDIFMLGFTSSKLKILEPRFIKTYVHRARAKPDDWQVNNFGFMSINEINSQIPKGFSGGPVLTNDFKIFGMSLSTNHSETNSFIIEEIIENSPTEKKTIEIKEKTYYGIFHSTNDVREIINLGLSQVA